MTAYSDLFTALTGRPLTAEEAHRLIALRDDEVAHELAGRQRAYAEDAYRVVPGQSSTTARTFRRQKAAAFNVADLIDPLTQAPRPYRPEPPQVVKPDEDSPACQLVADLERQPDVRRLEATAPDVVGLVVEPSSLHGWRWWLDRTRAGGVTHFGRSAKATGHRDGVRIDLVGQGVSDLFAAALGTPAHPAHPDYQHDRHDHAAPHVPGQRGGHQNGSTN
ncbi:hypothetical protein RM572_00800 [Streptomyces sp. DSM 42041]|uniref:Uncharacterized protein n=1 Tax=Streptomyces hazeniae TaxID=3075538 RepID=A0ABU2NKQ3_9ACTN|nr:hypothetical protein [Streptomyces sp. DSM 42041]MDT0377314.1 hypothetical protein [Streptomyces sp. DSM 42041]